MLLAVACLVSTAGAEERYKLVIGNTSRAQTTTMIPRSSDGVNQRCFTSGMDVINMFGYKPVRSVITVRPSSTI